jgi:hypothetical protein
MKYLGIKEVTTSRQKANGTRAFKTPFKVRRKPVRFYSYKRGYVRIDRNCHSMYQINKTYDVDYKVVMYNGEFYQCKSRKRIMIYNEESRLNYILAYILKNYFKLNTNDR